MVSFASVLGEAGKRAAGDILEQVTGVPFGGGTRNISTATASTAVNVNPAITVIGGSGTANPSTGGSAVASPSPNISANNPFQPYGAGRPPPQAEVDVIDWQKQSGSPSGSIIDGIPDELLIGGAGLAAFLAFNGG